MIDRRPRGYVLVLMLLVSILCSSLLTTNAALAALPTLELDAKAAVLLDYETGQVLFSKNPHEAIAPASLTKLMTLHLAFKRIESGGMRREDRVNISPDAWSAKMVGSSVMFLEPGQRVTVGEIMKGLAIPSGNDAAIALAQHMAGSVDAFVELMNKEARDMGYQVMHFTEPAGLSPQNVITAMEFADFARRYIQMHPTALSELHSVREFRYPLWENLSPEAKQRTNQATYKPIVQWNRNGLLDSFEGVDGLKTGFIDESGYNIALTAMRHEMRLVAVILGVPGKSEAEGSRKREQAGTALLSWGFQNFVTVKPPVGEIKPVRVWKGATNQVTLEPERPVVVTVARGQENALTRTLHQEASVMAPIKKGDKLGELVYATDGKEVARVPLVATADVGQGGLLKRIWDALRLWVSGLLQRDHT